MSKELFIDIIGWIGSIEVILAYGLISAKKVASDSTFYQWLNLTGSVLLIINTVYYGAFPSSVVNLIWVIIAIWALAKINFTKTTVDQGQTK